MQNQTEQVKINLGQMPLGTTYICRDGSEVVIEDYLYENYYPYEGSNGESYMNSGCVHESIEDGKDIIAVKPAAATKPRITVEVGKKYVRRDGKTATVLNGPDRSGLYYTDQNFGKSQYKAYVYSDGSTFKNRSNQPEDLVAEYIEPVAEPSKLSQYETIIQIASSIQEAGGSVSVLQKITLEDFLNLCEKNNIEITVKYNKGAINVS